MLIKSKLYDFNKYICVTTNFFDHHFYRRKPAFYRFIFLKIAKSLSKSGDQLIYFSDYIGVTKGDIVSLNIECESEEEIKKYYERLKEESKVEMELQDTFWGAKFAHLIDKFGVNWSLNYQKSE
jgi:uncharacterized glyoxalase superfamily protein PhnB